MWHLMGLGLSQPRVIMWIRNNVWSHLIEDPSLTTKAVHKVVHKYNKSGTQSYHRVLKKSFIYLTIVRSMVPAAGLEPARPLSLRILSPLCLPFHHAGKAANIGKMLGV